MRVRSVLFWWMCGFFVLAAFPGRSYALDLEQQRKAYAVAINAIRHGDWEQYQRLRPSLDDYPLAIYLDYYELTGNGQRVSVERAEQFMADSRGTALPNRFLRSYLGSAGRRGRWSDFLAMMSQEPASEDLKCYYYRALYHTGDRDAAYAGAASLWVHSHSRPKICDPLFTNWQRAGGLNDDLVWARLLQTVDARQTSLSRYVARKGSPALKPWADRMMSAYASPTKLAALKLPENEAKSADIATAALKRLARSDQEAALKLWLQFKDRLPFEPAQVREVERQIALYTLFRETESNLAWLQPTLARLQDDTLVEIRLRWAIASQDWGGFRATLPLLSSEAARDSGWRYWSALATEQAGRQEQAKEELVELASERGYYSFLAADRLGQPYKMNNKSASADSNAGAAQADTPALRRVTELTFHDAQRDAHAEWSLVLSSSAPEQLPALARLAADRGWYRFAIDAANRAKEMDWLDMRFPPAYRETFEQYAGRRGVPTTELMAIARRESAFMPQITSSAGARGLMQVMPATGKQVANRVGVNYSREALYEVDDNVLLGSAYYRELLDQFDNNRIYALAAYNAGPHRVERWRADSAGQLPVEAWIETIPFKETRAYVQAVLAYNVVFGELQGAPSSLLSDAERQARY